MFPINFDHSGLAERLYPFAETRNILDIRVGILTLREKWAWLLKDGATNTPASVTLAANTIPTEELTNLILSGKYPPELNGSSIRKIEYPWHIFQLNDAAIR